MAQDMGLGRIGSATTLYKRSYRWMVDISDGNNKYIGQDAPMLPPNKGSRPEVSFNEMKAEHLVETVTFPGRPEWSTLDLTVYDITCKGNKIFEWLTKVYDPQQGIFKPALDGPVKIGEVNLKLFDGCGNVVEQWRYENCWPQKIQWGALDMGSSEVLMVELVLKYDRAYIVKL